ncbi:hypothetical protein SNEBB_010360 [Seison nebaliae]|nr:hypothetical protein SNEBB_010360 [Seison nebaliae]
MFSNTAEIEVAQFILNKIENRSLEVWVNLINYGGFNNVPNTGNWSWGGVEEELTPRLEKRMTGRRSKLFNKSPSRGKSCATLVVLGKEQRFFYRRRPCLRQFGQLCSVGYMTGQRRIRNDHFEHCQFEMRIKEEKFFYSLLKYFCIYLFVISIAIFAFCDIYCWKVTKMKYAQMQLAHSKRIQYHDNAMKRHQYPVIEKFDHEIYSKSLPKMMDPL